LAIKKVTYKLDLKNKLSNVSSKSSALKDVADYLKVAILDKVSDGVSPVYGRGRFTGYSKEYKKYKSEFTSSSTVNLELTGSMLDSLKYEIDERSGTIEIGIWDTEAPKADGHNNHSGDSSLPLRRFIPKESEKFDLEIQGEIDNILQEYESANTEVRERTEGFITGLLRTVLNNGKESQ